MLRDTELIISEEVPFFGTLDDIKTAKTFDLKYGRGFSQLMGEAVDELVRTRPFDPVLPFVRAFQPKLQKPHVPPGCDPLRFPPLESVLSDIKIVPTVDSVGNLGAGVEICHDDRLFRFDTFFDEPFLGIQDNSREAVLNFKTNVMEKAQAFIREWMRDFLFKSGTLILKNYLNIEQSFSTFFDTKTEISEPAPSPVDLSGKNTKKQHTAAKPAVPGPVKKKTIERIKYNAVEDGFLGIYLTSFALLSLISHQLNVPIRKTIRLLANLVLPEAQWPVTIPLPFVATFAMPKKHDGKVKILQEIHLVPKDTWNPAEFFRKAHAILSNFKKKMAIHQQVNVYKQGSFHWNLEKIADAFGPVRHLTAEEALNARIGVTLNTVDLEDGKFLYDIKGKAKGVESMVKILSALVRRDESLIAIFNPLHVEHRDKLKPLCERWTAQKRKLLFFHDKFHEFNEALKIFSAQFRGALISIKPEETVKQLIKKVADAHALGIPVCLQNTTGLLFADGKMLVEIAVGLGVEYVKIDSPGRPEIFETAEFYEQLTSEYLGNNPLRSHVSAENHGFSKLEKIYTTH